VEFISRQGVSKSCHDCEYVGKMQYNAIHTIAAKVATISKMQLRIGISNTSVSLTRCQTVGRGAGVNEAYLPVVSETCWEKPDPCFLVDGSGGATPQSMNLVSLLRFSEGFMTAKCVLISARFPSRELQYHETKTNQLRRSHHMKTAGKRWSL